MADTTTRYKMNVRSPYYVVVKDEGKPEPPADDPDISDEEPDVPDEYQQPDTLTEGVVCGDVVNIGEDVGVRIFRLNTKNRTGDVDIDFTASIPIKIQASWDGNVVDANNGDYLGDSQFNQQLLDAGIPSADIHLTSGGATGTLTINKSTESPSEVLVQVTAPLQNDDYNLTFNCPPAPSRSAPSLPTPDGTNLAFNVPAFLFGGSAFVAQPPELRINGTVVPTSMSFNDVANTFLVITDFSNLGNFLLNTAARRTHFVSKQTYIKNGDNEISLTHDSFYGFGDTTTLPMRGGIFHNGVEWGWATTYRAHLYEYNISTNQANGVFSYGQSLEYNQDTTKFTFTWTEDEANNVGFFGDTVRIDTPSGTFFRDLDLR